MWLLMGSEELNTGSQAFLANALPIKPSSQSRHNFFPWTSLYLGPQLNGATHPEARSSLIS